MRKHIVLITYLFCYNICFGQIKKTNNLIVGDIVPDIHLQNIINYSSSSVRISDFKNKLLILDFWATWCSPCISSFPKLDSLQTKFGDKLQILGVTSENKDIVESFLKRMSKVKNISLPASVTSDKKLRQLFYYTSIPHYVWIDKNGKVIAITESKDVSEKNIDTYFREGKFNYTLKEDQRGQVIGIPRFTQSVIFQKEGVNEIRKLDSTRLPLHSVLTKYVEGISGDGQFDPPNYIFWGNCTILRLYKTAIYGNSFRVLNSSPLAVIVEIEDSALYTHVTSRTPTGKKLSSGLETIAWLKENGYCYELSVPHSLSNEKYKIMLEQLNLYFGALYGIEGVIERRMSKYLSLIRTSNENKIQASESEEKTLMNSFYIKTQNTTIQTLVNRLALPLQKYPLLEDETGYKGKVTIELNCLLADLKALNKELLKYDLQIVEKEKEMNVAVIRMKQNK